ncbi:MAG: TOBE domain-containing protein [Betaproteobacteria bacterium]
MTTVLRMQDGFRLLASILLVFLVSTSSPAAVLVEGAPVNADVHPTETLVKYGPIFDALKIMHSYNAETRTIKVRRPYDNAVLELVVPEGQVRANARVIGTIPNADREKPADGWLSPNAISILSGTIARNTSDGWAFDLDERLRPDANLQLWINGKPVTPPVPPRSAGALLLVPLRPVAEALGSKITVDGAQISVVRLQDGVVVSWNSASGLVVANTFLGSTSRVRVADEGGDRTLTADISTAQAAPLTVGTKVVASFPPDSPRLLSLADEPVSRAPDPDSQ